MPCLNYFWRDNPLFPKSTKRSPLAKFGAARIKERMSMTEDEKKAIHQRDYLSRFMKEKSKDDTLPDL